MKRTPIFNALLTLLQGQLAPAGPFVTVSPKWVSWTEFSKEAAPACFLVDENENPRLTANAPTIWTCDLLVVIYAFLPSSDTAGRAAVLNPLLDAVDTALTAGSPQGVNTLGGLVDRVSVSGKIEKYGGIGDEIIIAAVPLQYVVPD